MLEREFNYYLVHQKELVNKYNGKFLVIIGEKIAGKYNSFDEALLESQKRFKPGTFLIHRCGPGKDNYTQKFHSRAIFS